MAQQIQCPNCGQTYELSDEQAPQYAGQTITCTRCQKAFTVPRTVGGAATAAPPSVPQGGGAPMRPPTQGTGVPPQYVAYGQGGYGPQKQTSGLAIASLVLAIIGLIIPGLGLVGLVLGIIALTKMRDPQVGGKGLAIGGIAVGAASVLWLGCMISILVPSLGRARETANRVKCASNMRQIGQAILLYSNDNRGAYPDKLDKLLTTQDITSECFVCPDTKDTPAPGAAGQPQANALNSGGHLSYVYVGAGLNNAASQDTVILYEPMTNHGGEGSNFLWGDGHVSWEGKQQANQIIQQVKNGQNPPKLGRQ